VFKIKNEEHDRMRTGSSTNNPRWISYLLTASLIVLWAIGVLDAVLGGMQPGYARRDVIHPYPLWAVVITCAIITVESVGLFAILRPASFIEHPRRAVIGFAICLPVCGAEFFFVSGWTDQAGYCYSNGLFLRTALALLLLAACLGFAARARLHTHGPEPARPP